MSYTTEELEAHRAEWIAALRSGDYKQAKGALRRGDSFCCLGVACEVAARHGVTERVKNGYKDPQGYYPAATSLPVAVRDWLGLKGTSGGLVESLGGGRSLDALNDSGRWTFEQLADLIEAGRVKLKEEQ